MQAMLLPMMVKDQLVIESKSATNVINAVFFKFIVIQKSFLTISL